MLRGVVIGRLQIVKEANTTFSRHRSAGDGGMYGKPYRPSPLGARITPDIPSLGFYVRITVDLGTSRGYLIPANKDMTDETGHDQASSDL